MHKKIVIKIAGLIFLLALVILASRGLSEPEITTQLNQIFDSSAKTLKWCPEHAVDIKWLDQNLTKNIEKKWHSANISAQIEYLCSIPYEEEKRQETGTFVPFLQIQSADGKTAVIEWQPENQLFRAQGLIFKSLNLSRELLDEVP